MRRGPFADLSMEHASRTELTTERHRRDNPLRRKAAEKLKAGE